MWEYARYISSGMKMKEEEEAQLEGKNILCTDIYICVIVRITPLIHIIWIFEYSSHTVNKTLFLFN